MNIDIQIPAAALRPFVKSYLIIESQDELTNRVLPDTGVVMAFRYKGAIGYGAEDVINNLPSMVVSGLRKSARLINYADNTGNILVLFKEAGAAAFLKAPLHELFEKTEPLDNFIHQRKISIIQEQLSEAGNSARRIAVIERFLLAELYDQRLDPLILAAVQKIHLVQGVCRVKDLASEFYISQDAFEKRFRRVVGTSPKQFSSVIRMKSVIDGGRQKQRLTDIAFEAGYFDQPHFNKDFKLFTGQTPTDFFRSPSFW
jgi:AraC-like DNA-binding protein